MRYVFFSTVHERIRKHNISPVPQLAYTFSIIFSMMGTVKEYDRVKTNEVNVQLFMYRGAEKRDVTVSIGSTRSKFFSQISIVCSLSIGSPMPSFFTSYKSHPLSRIF